MDAAIAIEILRQKSQETMFLSGSVMEHRHIILKPLEKALHKGHNQWWAVIGSPSVEIESDNGGYSVPNTAKSNEQRHLHTGAITLHNPGATESTVEFLTLYIP